jgi:hypothetical protein
MPTTVNSSRSPLEITRECGKIHADHSGANNFAGRSFNGLIGRIGDLEGVIEIALIKRDLFPMTDHRPYALPTKSLDDSAFDVGGCIDGLKSKGLCL